MIRTPADLVRLYSELGLKLAAAESCTGGLLGGAITSAPGSSVVFAGGVVSYSNRIKRSVLGVSQDALDRHGAVSEQVAMMMASGVRTLFDVDVGISITGIAGPASEGDKPVGRVCFALSERGNSADWSMTMEYGPTGREVIRQKSVETALRLLGDLADAPAGT